jgi:hypothetical protein
LYHLRSINKADHEVAQQRAIRKTASRIGAIE